MHYNLGNGIVVKAENAAKPFSQTSKYLNELLESLDDVEAAFDYGCGKLRYQKAILNHTDSLCNVDSEIQLSRRQNLLGEETTIREIVSRTNRVSVANDIEFQTLTAQFDRGFCINVLSTVPIISVRQEILNVVHSHLAPSALCLFVVQYRNSDFTRMRKLPNAQPWLDGFLVNSLRGYSFYGLISPNHLVSLLESASFSVKSIKLNEGSAYAWAGRKDTTLGRLNIGQSTNFPQTGKARTTFA